eukprot:549739-Amphidinium_carterae.3
MTFPSETFKQYTTKTAHNMQTWDVSLKHRARSSKDQVVHNSQCPNMSAASSKSKLGCSKPNVVDAFSKLRQTQEDVSLAKHDRGSPQSLHTA